MITEVSQEERLKKYSINIKTKYKSNDKILERNTDNSKNDNIINGIRLSKTYYQKGQVLKKENIFDSRILYTFEFNDEVITCKNCGMQGKTSEFKDGCVYCQTYYNIDYTNKELGSKFYYDLIIRNRGYIIKTLIIDLLISFIISYLYIVSFSRTFYMFDFLKIIAGTFLIGLILFLIFYYLDAVILLPRIKKKKERENLKQQEFWKRLEKLGIEKIKFFNNLNYDLKRLYYSDKYPFVLDYDIIDYNNFEEKFLDNKLFVTVNLDIRIVSIYKNKIKSKIENKTYLLQKVKIDKEVNGSVNHIECSNCGASVNILEKKCSYCGSEYNYLQEWYLVKEL